MKFKGEVIEPEPILGQGTDLELAMIMLPMTTYRALAEQATKEGITVASMLSKALSEYVNKDKHKETLEFPNEPKQSKIDFSFKKRK